ncbi:MAG TPA: energy transducer TonB [Terriglobales bacterium]|jgi:TonB family protein|nr:energy transducer TonB [Terriglobales bacterium]
MTLLRTIICSTIMLVLFAAASSAEDIQKTAEGLLNGARQLGDIRSPNAPPFQMKLTFSFVGKDLETSEGTYSEVWISNSQWRRETTVGNFRRIEVGGPTRRWLLDSGGDFPEEAAGVSSLLNVFPARTAKFQFESIASPDAETQCAVTKPWGDKRKRLAFCFDKASGFLVENVTPQLVGAQRVVDFSCNYGQFKKFGVYAFPRTLTCFLDGHRKMEAKVVELSTMTSPDATLFSPPPASLELGNCSLNPLPPQAVNTHYPLVPLGTSKNTSVTLWMIVNVKGEPQGVKVIRSAGKQFDDPAMNAVRAWHFKPATCNGEPMPAPISVEIRFGRY